MFNPNDNYKNVLYGMSLKELNALVHDVRTQVGLGLMSGKEAHDKINIIATVIMVKDMEERDFRRGENEENDLISSEFEDYNSEENF